MTGIILADVGFGSITHQGIHAVGKDVGAQGAGGRQRPFCFEPNCLAGIMPSKRYHLLPSSAEVDEACCELNQVRFFLIRPRANAE
jgi:hypothetical protein